MTNTGGIILAAGKGKRMKSKGSNKVTEKLGNKPMVVHAVHLLEEAGVSPIIIVVGFAKESVTSLFDGNVLFAQQNKRLGTAHAASQGVKILKEDVKSAFVLNGDDSAFYSKEIFNNLYEAHSKNRNAVTMLTLKVKNPAGLGRIVRNSKGEVVGIVEEKDATRKERKINEINPGCYLFDKDFLNKYLPKVKKSEVTNEYYIVSLIEIAVKNGKRVEAIDGGNVPWRGVNTEDELAQAEKLFKKHKQNYI